MRSLTRLLKPTRNMLVLLCLMLLLPSCVTLPVPPAQYLSDCKLTYLVGDAPTVGDVTQLALDREFDLRVCNVDKRALRAWYEGYEQACGWRCKSEDGEPK